MDAQSSIPLTEKTRTLNNEQIQWLLSRLSSDDQKELSNILRDCTSEMTLTRGLPFSAAVLGSLYFARSRLPEQLRVGPKRWPFYALIGVGALTTANLLSMNVCTERVRPKLQQLYEKGAAASATRYDQLREQNRSHLSGAPASNVVESNIASSYTTRQPRYDQQTASTSSGGRFLYEDPPSYISGTPIGNNPTSPPSNSGNLRPNIGGNAPRPVSAGTGTSYGDSDFS